MNRLLLVLTAALAAAPAAASVTVARTDLQLSIQSRKGRPVFHSLESLLLPPDAKPAPRLRARLHLSNDARHAETGVVIRFCVTARVRPVKGAGEGTWTVPFLLEEKHLPRLAAGPDVTVPLPINRVALGDYLNSLRMAGYWIDGLRFDAAVAPRRGETLDGHIGTRTIPVDWKPAPAKAAP
ncbi:MAG: hypothetical protein KGL53_05130 [Elusimicrobia bacterium]|nr:hypothetical protein [Elusimicrobiota bacterium]